MINALSFGWSRRGIVHALAAGFAALFSSPAAAQQISTWSLQPDARVEIGVVSAETATRDEQIVVNGDALTFRGQVGLDLEDENTRFRLEADRIEVVRLGEGRRDTNRDRITMLVDQEFGDDWEVQVRGRYYDDLVTAESSDTDEIQGSVRVTYEPVRAHRLRVRGTWREREYDNRADPQTTGSGLRVDVGYRHRIDRYHYINFDLRAESIDSADPECGYSRESAKVSYTRPITRDLRIRPALEVLETRFDGRLTPDGDRRKDRLIVPELELHWWPKRWRVEAEAKYIFSDSNLATRQREGYRLTLTVGYVF
ncbi:hypothetical protein [Altererythrobacter lutimaris]|uniref:DUF481 domain-containing protein n=1 Tax=Altererythrobacter lutimaris TaxID=2743979 RepID=A0A850HIA6_9SPHN|nr:hypothetical protein [Altererythrobacter lutimaris]NVE95192.1 hypothetical protein [Altererythrobacter lutimaris]